MGVLGTVLHTWSDPAMAATNSYTGTVDAKRTSWQAGNVSLDANSTVTAKLQWATRADLNLFLRDASGASIAESTSTTMRPEVLTGLTLKAGTYSWGVKAARGGSSPFTVTITSDPVVTTTTTSKPVITTTTSIPVVTTTTAPAPAGLPIPSNASPGATSTSNLRVFSYTAELSSHAWTLAEALDVARRYDVVVAGRWQFASFVADMRAANPNLKLFIYVNGTFAQSPNEDNAFAPELYANDPSGARIRSAGYGNWFMNISNPLWAASRASACASFVAQNSADGCFLDVVDNGPLFAGYLTSPAINPATGQVYTNSEWMAQMVNIVTTVSSQNSSIVVTGNGIGNGERYSDAARTTKPVGDVLAIAMAETFMRNPEDQATAWPTADRVAKEVAVLQQTEAAGRGVLAITKLWSAADVATADRWNRLAFGTFLLGADGRSDFQFSKQNVFSGTNPWSGPTPDHIVSNPYATLTIGAPTGPALRQGDVFSRSFTGGSIVVNAGTQSVTVILPTRHQDLDGRLGMSFTLAPRTAQALTAV